MVYSNLNRPRGYYQNPQSFINDVAELCKRAPRYFRQEGGAETTAKVGKKQIFVRVNESGRGMTAYVIGGEERLRRHIRRGDDKRRHLRTLEGLAARYERQHRFGRQIEEIFDDFNRFEHDHTIVLAKARRQELIDDLRLYELSMADLFSLDESEWEKAATNGEPGP